jgi:ATPase subunit of ABC transporter with duplicated ATPase domains
LPIYHPGFKLTEDVAQKILSTFSQYITTAMNNGYKDGEAKHLRDEIVKGKEIKYQEAVKLAVAGDTGAGKSALLNAILGVINLNIEVRPNVFSLSGLQTNHTVERRWWSMHLCHHRISTVTSHARDAIRSGSGVLRPHGVPSNGQHTLHSVVSSQTEAETRPRRCR